MAVYAPFKLRELPPSFDYGPSTAYGTSDIGTPEQRVEFANRMYKKPKNTMEYERVLRTILVGEMGPLISAAAVQWPIHVDVLNEWDRLEESKEETEEGLPSKQKAARDIYNLASNEQIATDDRLKAFRLYSEVQGFIGGKGGSLTNIDARSIILVPRRSTKLDDPEREAKVIQAQARLVTDAKRPA